MSVQQTSEDLARTHVVEVYLELSDQEGNEETRTFELPRGKTEVIVLKQELGLEEKSPLWVIKKDGKRKPLGNHEEHEVKEGDRYRAIVKGGVS